MSSSSRLGSRGVPIKDVLEMALGEVQLSCLKSAIPGQKTADQLLKLDEQGVCCGIFTFVILSWFLQVKYTKAS